MKVSDKKYFDDATLERAAKLIEKAELTLAEICKVLHTSLPTLKRNMDLYYNSTVLQFDASEKDIENINWIKSYKAKRKIAKRKRNTRIVYECHSCSYESEIEIEQCPKCSSLCIRKRELRNEVSVGELRTIKMTGRRKIKT